jgi:site-specific recombinase XerD
VSLQEIADAALAYSRIEKASYQHDEYRMVPILKQFGDRAAESILPEEFEAWLNAEAAERDWAPATKNRYIALLKLTYRLAERNRKIKSNPARLLRMRKENNNRVRYLNQHKPMPTQVGYLKDCKDEESRLRAVIRTEFPYHLPEFELALHLGVRRSEQYRTVWSDVDFDLHVLTIPRSKHGETRHVPINSTAMAIFDFLQARAEGHDHVFLSMRNNEPLNTNRHWFEDAVKTAGINDFHWHDLRHTFGSRLTMAGVGLRQVQELMGHKTISMTCRYSHLEPAHQLAAVERLVSYNAEHGKAGETKSGEPTATVSATRQTVRLDNSLHTVN